MNKKGRSLTPEFITNISKLVPKLRQEELTPNQMIEYLGMTLNPKMTPYGQLKNLLQRIGVDYPLFEPIPGHFKILTDQDIEEYRELQRRQGKYGNYMATLSN